MRSGDRLAARVGATAIASLLIVLITMHGIQPGLNPLDHFVSEYVYGRLGWLVPLAYVLAGSGTLLLAWPVVAWFRLTPRAVASTGSLILIGLGLIGTGLTRIDIAGSDGAVVSTNSGQLHELAGYVAIIGLSAGAFLIPVMFRRGLADPGVGLTLRRYRRLVLASLAGILVARPVGAIGLGQRFFLAVAMSWLVYVAAQLSRSDTHPMNWGVPTVSSKRT